MVLVRLAYAADLPAPAELVRQLTESGPPTSGGAPLRSSSAGVPAGAPLAGLGSSSGPRLARSAESSAGGAPQLAIRAEPATASPQPRSFDEVVALFDQHREAVLRSHLVAHVHLVNFEPGRIEFRPAVGAPRDLANRLGKLLSEWTATRWLVSVSGEEGAPTLREQAEAREASMRNEAAQHPVVRAVLESFPGARIEAVRELGAGEAPAGAEESSEGEESP
jgi:DNA polymerase-3 subunit gamma/tau